MLRGDAGASVYSMSGPTLYELYVNAIALAEVIFTDSGPEVSTGSY